MVGASNGGPMAPAGPIDAGFGALARRTPGLSWAAWWLDDAERSSPRASAPTACTEGRRRGRRGSDGDLAGGRSARLPRRVGGGERLAAPRAPPARPARAGPDHGWLAFHEGYSRTRRRHRDGRELAAFAAELGRRFGVADLEMLGLALEGSRARGRAREVEEGMRCLDEATARRWRARRRSRSPARGRAASWSPRARPCSTTSGRSSGATGSPSSPSATGAATCSRSAGPSTARCTSGAAGGSEAEAMLEAALDDFARSRPAWVGGPLVGLAELRRRQGRADEAARLLDRGGRRRGRAALPRAPGARRRETRSGPSSCSSGLLRQLPEHEAGPRPGARAARSARDRARRARRGGRGARGAARSSGSSARRRCGPAPISPRACSRPPRGDHERARTLLEDAVDRFERSGAPFEAAQARIELATSLLALGRADAAEREAAAALELLLELGADAEAERARGAPRRARPAARGSPAPELTPREREVLRLLAEGLTNRQIAERLVVSEHTVHRHVTNILRKLDLPSRTAAAAQAVRAGLLDSSGA